DRTTRCPSSLHVVTADTAPAWSRLKWIAEAIDTTASSLSRTANNAASESIQFSSHQARQTSASKGRNSKNASKGRGCDWGETKPTTMPEPANPTRAASAAATRKKFNLNTAANIFVETLLTTSLSSLPEMGVPAMLRK